MGEIIAGHLKRTVIIILFYGIIINYYDIFSYLDRGKEFLIQNFIISPLGYLISLSIAALPIILFFILAHKKCISKNYSIYFKILAVGAVPLYYFLPAYLENSPWHQLFGLILLISNLLVLAFNQDYYEKIMKKNNQAK